MTAPAQIEALKAIRDWTLKQPDTVWYDEITTLHDLCEQALAAAQVGEQYVPKDDPRMDTVVGPAAQVGEAVEDRAAQRIIEPIIKDAITVAVNATTERCARKAEWIGRNEGGGWVAIANAIAAAIRKMENDAA